MAINPGVLEKKFFTIYGIHGHLGHVNIFAIYYCQDVVHEIWLKMVIHLIIVTFGQGHWMTLAFGIHRGAGSTFFHIIEYHCFDQIQCFTFSLFKSPKDQIWPWWKIGQGQPRVTIWTVLTHLMLHNKFQGNQPSISGEEDFLSVLPYMCIVAILVRRPGPSEKIFSLQFPGCCILNLIEIGPVVSEEKSFEKVDDTNGLLSIL